MKNKQLQEIIEQQQEIIRNLQDAVESLQKRVSHIEAVSGIDLEYNEYLSRVQGLRTILEKTENL